MPRGVFAPVDHDDDLAADDDYDDARDVYDGGSYHYLNDGGADHHLDHFHHCATDLYLHLLLDNRTVDYFDRALLRLCGGAWNPWKF